MDQVKNFKSCCRILELNPISPLQAMCEHTIDTQKLSMCLQVWIKTKKKKLCKISKTQPLLRGTRVCSHTRSWMVRGYGSSCFCFTSFVFGSTALRAPATTSQMVSPLQSAISNKRRKEMQWWFTWVVMSLWSYSPSFEPSEFRDTKVKESFLICELWERLTKPWMLHTAPKKKTSKSSRVR